MNIHYPPSSYVGETTRKSVIADIPGLRLAKQIALVRTSESGTSQAMFGPQSNRLNLRLHNKVRLIPPTSAWELFTDNYAIVLMSLSCSVRRHDMCMLLLHSLSLG